VIAAIAVVASLLADAFLFAALAELFANAYSGPAPHAVAWWGFALVVASGFWLPRFLAGFDLPPRRAYLLTACGGLALVYLVIRIEIAGDVAIWNFAWVGDFLDDATEALERGGRGIVAVLLLGAAWARASYRAADEVEMESIPKSAAIPFALVTLIIIFGAASDRSGEVGRAGAAFFAFAIVALAASQLSLSGTTFGEARAGGTAGLLLVGAVAASAVGLVVFTVVAPIVGPIVGPVVGKVVEVTLTILLTPLAWALTEFFQLIMGGDNPFEGLSENLVQRSGEAASGEPDEQSPVSRASVYLLRVLALLAMGVLVSALVLVFVRLRKRQAARLVDATATGVAGDFRDDLRGWLRSLVPGRRGKDLDPGGSDAARLYLEVLHRAEHQGHPRRDGATPREYLPELHETFPTNVTDDITAAFEEARYGGREPDPRLLEELRRRWREVH
jgi:hypothetical protein